MKSKTRLLLIVAILVGLGIVCIICCSILSNRVKNNVNESENEKVVSEGSNEDGDDLETELLEVSTAVPTEEPIENPTAAPTEVSTEGPTVEPTAMPTEKPTVEPTEVPMEEPTVEPTAVPTEKPTEEPTAVPTEVPTEKPTAAPTSVPTEVPTQAPTVMPTTAPTVAPTAPTIAPNVTFAPVCNHKWVVANQKETVDCSRNERYIETSYTCDCGETKTDNRTEVAGCEYGNVYREWEYSYSSPECVRWTWSTPGCVTHGFAFEYVPEYVYEETHDKQYYRREPSCEEKGKVTVKCKKCDVYFIDEYEDIINEIYPDGGGNGHDYVVVETGIEWKVDYAEWYYTVMRLECTRCGKSYYESDGGPDYYYDENGNKVNF